MKRPPPPEPIGQRLFATVLLILAALGLIALFKALEERAPGKSRIDWPASTHSSP